MWWWILSLSLSLSMSCGGGGGGGGRVRRRSSEGESWSKAATFMVAGWLECVVGGEKKKERERHREQGGGDYLPNFNDLSLHLIAQDLSRSRSRYTWPHLHSALSAQKSTMQSPDRAIARIDAASKQWLCMTPFQSVCNH
jgi:hypothetical protein